MPTVLMTWCTRVHAYGTSYYNMDVRAEIPGYPGVLEWSRAGAYVG